MKKSRGISLIVSIVFSLSAFAQEPSDAPEAKTPKAAKEAKELDLKDLKEAPRKNEISDILDSMGYPELQVVPRATERLALEAKAEDSSAMITHWPIEVAGLATLGVALMNKGLRIDAIEEKQAKNANSITSATTVIGAGWLVTGLILGMQRPYRSGLSSLEKYKGKDERSTLLRERLAEEALEKPAKTMRILTNFSVWSCLLSNIGNAWYANDNGKVYAGVGALISMMPWFFDDHTIEVYDKHIEYKKKIYTPLKTAYFSYDQKSKSYTPMAGLAWEF